MDWIVRVNERGRSGVLVKEANVGERGVGEERDVKRDISML